MIQVESPRTVTDGRSPELAENGYNGDAELAGFTSLDWQGRGVVSIGNGLPSPWPTARARFERFSEWRNLTYSRFSRAARASPPGFDWGGAIRNEDKPAETDIDNIYSSPIRLMERSKEREDTLGRDPTDTPPPRLFFKRVRRTRVWASGFATNNVPRCGCKVTYGRCPLWNPFAQAKWPSSASRGSYMSSTLRFYS